jgi:hypothetical protein
MDIEELLALVGDDFNSTVQERISLFQCRKCGEMAHFTSNNSSNVFSQGLRAKVLLRPTGHQLGCLFGMPLKDTVRNETSAFLPNQWLLCKGS